MSKIEGKWCLSSQSQEKEKQHYGAPGGRKKKNKELNCPKGEREKKVVKGKKLTFQDAVFYKKKKKNEGKDWEVSSQFPNPELSNLIPTSIP